MRLRATLVLSFIVAACGDSNGPSAAPDGGGASPSDAGAPDAAHGGGGADATDAGNPTGSSVHIRVMAANLTSGTQQSYEDPGIRIFQGLAPDVVLIQEFKYAAGPLRSLVDTAFGTSYDFYVETRMGGIPNGVVSRYPIKQSGAWVDTNVPDRAFVYACIDVPGPVDLWAVSLHLLTTGATQRDAEAKELVPAVMATIPKGDYLVLGGDFNTDTTDEAVITDLSSVVVTSFARPSDQTGNAFTSINRNRPHDWVLAGPSLHARAIPTTIGASSYANGLVFDSRVYTPLSEVAPVMVGDSAATGMQHMPVIRDFALDGDADGGASDDAGTSDAGGADASDGGPSDAGLDGG